MALSVVQNIHFSYHSVKKQENINKPKKTYGQILHSFHFLKCIIRKQKRSIWGVGGGGGG